MLVTKTIILAATVSATRCDVHLTENRDIDFPVGKKITSHGKSIPHSPEGFSIRKMNRNQVAYGKRTR